jgi:pimeloyl-ACP methyl ester carboxylesterase
VVFDHATMHLSQQFHKVVRALGSANRTVRVCLVDRAGYGFSDAPEHDSEGPAPRTAEVSAEELFKALHRAGEEPPFVLVGHSSGGVNQLLYAVRHGHGAPLAASDSSSSSSVVVESDVAGLVLIDPMPPGFRLPKKLQDMKQTVATGLRLVPWLARSGVLRNCFYLSSLTGQADAIYAADDLHYRRWAECKPAYWRTVLSEFESEDGSLTIERHEPSILARRWTFPLVVVAAGRLAPSFDEATREAWMAGMRRLTTYSAGGQLIIADESSHEVPSEQPDLVAQAILSVLDTHHATHSQAPAA